MERRSRNAGPGGAFVPAGGAEPGGAEPGRDDLRSRRPDGPTPTSDPSLVARIGAEIAAAGPLTFARFMELALYDPQAGYYRTPPERPTRRGDFLTAAEMDPIFGRTVGRWLAAAWEALRRPDPFTVIEYGAGSGALGTAAAEGMRRVAPAALRALRYVPLELNEHRSRELLERFEAAGLTAHLGRPDASPGGPAVGVVLANEFLDALPVHRVEVHDGALRERFVGWACPQPAGGAVEPGGAIGLAGGPADPAHGLVELLGPPSTPALAARLADEGIRLAEGQQAEICLELDPWLDDVQRRLGRGVVVVIDYGRPATELYAPERRRGTLLAYAGHRTSEAFLRGVGRQDLTAHVDLTAVERAAAARGLAILGRTTQQAFLVAAGLGDELVAVQADPGAALEGYAAVRSAVRRLLDPRALGGFRVLLLGRGVPPDLPLPGRPPASVSVDVPERASRP